MLETVLKGLIVGILVSAPLGPIGMLCVQRTLTKGRWHGFVTGLGAVTSDIVFAFITLLGMGFVTDFLEGNKNTIQVIGSLILLVFGVYVFRSNPLKSVNNNDDEDSGVLGRYFVTAFFLNLSNVPIILLFIAMYARVDFDAFEKGGWHILLGLLGIVLGATLWWFGVSTVVSKLSKYFNRTGLRLFNRFIGVILMAIGLIGAITGTIALVQHFM